MKKNQIPLNKHLHVGANVLAKAVYTAMMLLTIILVSGTFAHAQMSIEKTLLGVSPAPTAGHIYVNYEVRVTNDNVAPFTSNNNVLDDISAAFGAAFIGVSSAPSIVLGSTTASIAPVPNINYDGGLTTDSLLAQGTGLVTPSQYYTVAYSVEINTSVAGGDLTNTATAFGEFLPGTGDASGSPQSSATLQNCWSNCAIACNNQINISVNTMCEAEILADMVLEGEDETCAELGIYRVEIQDLDGNPLAMPLDRSYIGEKLKVVVENIACGNSCWGNLLVEDKTPPRLMCDSDTIECDESISPFNPDIGFPVPLGDITTQIDDNTFEAANIDACGSVILSYRDSVDTRDCTDPEFSSIIYRKWTATDASGLMVMCWDTIYLNRGTVADVILPPHYDGIGGNEPYLDCDGDWCKLPNGFPAPEECGTGAPYGILCGNIQFDYWDDTLKVCETTYKLLRTWFIIDWCNPEDKIEYIQQIKVVDDNPPLVICPTRRPLELSMGRQECSRASFIVPDVLFDPTGQAAIDNPHNPVVVEECGSFTYTVRHLSINETAKSPDECGRLDLSQTFETSNVRQLNDGRWEVFDIPAGCNWIKYTITDDCGNSVECGLEIYIVDDVEPVAICHEHTVVSLTADGKGRAYAQSFDDGSHDNCGLGRMEVRRMTRGRCSNPNIADDTRFRDYVEFCCEDIARNPIMVVLRIWDECENNFSECMVEVTVQDKLPPVITFCPGPVTIDCQDDYNPLSQFGNAEAFDNCNVRVTSTAQTNLNTCGVGTIIRTFTATDDGGRTATCSQVITVENRDPFVEDDIIFPNDTTLNNGCLAGTDPDNLGKPRFIDLNGCDQIASSYEDLVFSRVDGACLKILRRWSVIDWCQFDPANADECYPINPGRWCKTQVIKVNDNDGPEFTSCNPESFCIDRGGCSVLVELQADAIDKCTPADLLIWRYEFDEDADGDIDRTGSRNFFNRVLGVGTHAITWIVEDQCGNTAECSYEFEVKDCKQPTPYCKPGVITVIMPTTKSIAIWANDFDLGSFDNCTDTSDLVFSFSSDTADKGRTFTCADLNGATSDTFTVTIYVTDEAGNQDFCETSFILQDNNGVCAGNITGTIAGLVKSRMDELMPEVMVSLTGIQMAGSKEFMTDDQGEFAFTNIEMYDDYQVNATLDDEAINGITTMDLVMIQRHLLGYQEFTSPYEYIAADVNNNSGISARDISELRKLILGVYSEFPDNESWRFIDADQQFVDPAHPFPFDEILNVDNFDKDAMDQNFIAVKIGDVSGDAEIKGAKGNTTRSEDIVYLSLGEVIQTEVSKISVPVVIEENDADHWFGMQFTMSFNADKLNFADVHAGVLNIASDNVALISAEEGILTFSWNNPEGARMTSGETLFDITFEVVNGQFTQDWIEVNSRVTVAEAYDTDMNIYRVGWKGQKSADGFVLHQNTPNPFRGTTTIAFELPKPTDYTLEIFDVSGKVLREFSGTGYDGYQQLEIDLSEFSESAVLYYQLNTGKFTATKKMVIIE